MHDKRKTRQELEGKIIDVHSHVGIHAGMYENLDYPCCQSIEGLYYRQLAGGVDVNVVFPWGSCPAGKFPYDIDNRRLMKEVYEFCPEISERFLPFICFDTANQVTQQISAAKTLTAKYPLYGIKINPVDRKVHVKTLLSEGRAILDFASEANLPMLFHAAPASLDEYSSTEDILDIAEKFPSLRFCLAHSLLFCKDLLDRTNPLPNVWVDTAALKIQVDLVRDLVKTGKLDKNLLIDANFNDHCDVLKKLVAAYPDKIIWGTDSPAYTFMTCRQQADGEFFNFRLHGRYEDEIIALRCLNSSAAKLAANKNTLDFIFEKDK